MEEAGIEPGFGKLGRGLGQAAPPWKLQELLSQFPGHEAQRGHLEILSTE